MILVSKVSKVLQEPMVIHHILERISIGGLLEKIPVLLPKALMAKMVKMERPHTLVTMVTGGLGRSTLTSQLKALPT